MKKQNSKSNFFYFTLFSIIVILIELIVFFYLLFLWLSTAIRKDTSSYSEFQFWFFWVLNLVLILIFTAEIFSYLEKKYFPSKSPKVKIETGKIEQERDFLEKLHRIILIWSLKIEAILGFLSLYMIALIPEKLFLYLLTKTYLGFIYLLTMIVFGLMFILSFLIPIIFKKGKKN